MIIIDVIISTFVLATATLPFLFLFHEILGFSIFGDNDQQ